MPQKLAAQPAPIVDPDRTRLGALGEYGKNACEYFPSSSTLCSKQRMDSDRGSEGF
jgi:hypothetical protein